jgi:hypothetical protein
MLEMTFPLMLPNRAGQITECAAIQKVVGVIRAT